MCPADLLPAQFVHSLMCAFAVLGVGVIALGLDVFASMIGKLGAREHTVNLLKVAALALLALDLGVTLIFAFVAATRLLWCLF